jgi:hypothetical protein
MNVELLKYFPTESPTSLLVLMADFDDDFGDLGDLDLELTGSGFNSDRDTSLSADKTWPPALGKESPGVRASGHLPLSDKIDFDAS